MTHERLAVIQLKAGRVAGTGPERPSERELASMARVDKPVIIEAAINGGATKAANPHVPISPDEHVADILASLEAGAAIVHHHDTLASTDRADRLAEVAGGVFRQRARRTTRCAVLPRDRMGWPDRGTARASPPARRGRAVARRVPRPRLDQPRGRRRRRSARADRLHLRAFTTRGAVVVRRSDRVGARSDVLDLRAELPPRAVGLRTSRTVAARLVREALLLGRRAQRRSRVGVRHASAAGLPRCVPCDARRFECARGPLRSSAATSSRADWPDSRSSVADTYASGSRTMSVTINRPTPRSSPARSSCARPSGVRSRHPTKRRNCSTSRDAGQRHSVTA